MMLRRYTMAMTARQQSMKTRNFALLTLLMVGVFSAACGDRAAAPEKVASTSTSTAGSASGSGAGSGATTPYTVLSETPQGTILMVNVQVPRTSREPEVKSAVESVVASRKARYSQISVRTFLEGATESDSPYAISRFKGDSIRHEFFSSALEQKIPTH